MNKFNCWKNYETWNVALWIQNDEYFYKLAKECKHLNNPYACFVSTKELNCSETPDGVSWSNAALDFTELNKMIGEL